MIKSIRSILLSSLFLLISHPVSFGQTDYQDAEKINGIRDLYLKTGIDISFKGLKPASPRTEPLKELLTRVIEYNGQSGFIQAQPDPNTGDDGFLEQPVRSETNPSKPKKDIRYREAEMQLAQKELYYISLLIRAEQKDLRLEEWEDLLENFPAEFKYLDGIAAALSDYRGMAEGTSAGIAGALFNMPEEEILMAMVEWSVNRAKEELLQAFLQEWLTKIQQEPVLQVLFPNTLNLLRSSDLTTLISQGETWKAAFIKDFIALPDNLDEVLLIILSRIPNAQMPAKEKRELVGMVRIAGTLFNEMNKGRRPDEVIQQMAEQVYLQHMPDYGVNVSISEQAALSTGILLRSLQIVQDGQLKCLTASDLIRLNDQQFSDFILVHYLRNWKKWTLALNPAGSLPTNQRDLAKVGLETLNMIMEQQAAFRKLLIDIAAIQNELIRITSQLSNQNRNGQEFDYAVISQYFRLVNDLFHVGFDLLEAYGDPNDASVQRAIAQWNEIGKPLSGYLMDINEGIATRHYGQVITGSLGIIELLTGMTIIVEIEYPFLQNELITFAEKVDCRDLNRLGKEGLNRLIESELSEHPTLVKELQKQVKKMRPDKTDNTDCKEFYYQLSVLISDTNRLKDLAISYEGFLRGSLYEVSKYLGNYGRFMVNIINAEDKEQIKEAFDEAAMRTGGYLVKQTSTQSVIVTFMPGFGAGQEFLRDAKEDIDEVDLDNNYFWGAKLPIGVEYSWGYKKSIIGSNGIFLQVMDLGALLNYSLNEQDSLASLPSFGFKQVLSPGAYFLTHLRKNPVTLGIGVSYSPDLREIRNGNATFDANALQVGAFIGVDVSVFTIWASERKFGLNYPSMRKRR